MFTSFHPLNSHWEPPHKARPRRVAPVASGPLTVLARSLMLIVPYAYELSALRPNGPCWIFVITLNLPFRVHLENSLKAQMIHYVQETWLIRRSAIFPGKVYFSICSTLVKHMGHHSNRVLRGPALESLVDRLDPMMHITTCPT